MLCRNHQPIDIRTFQSNLRFVLLIMFNRFFIFERVWSTGTVKRRYRLHPFNLDTFWHVDLRVLLKQLAGFSKLNRSYYRRR